MKESGEMLFEREIDGLHYWISCIGWLAIPAGFEHGWLGVLLGFAAVVVLQICWWLGYEAARESLRKYLQRRKARRQARDGESEAR